MSEKIKSEQLGTGLLSKAAKALEERKKRQREMNKRFGISSPQKSNTNK